CLGDLLTVRADRMRGGRNTFGPMYKRDRALKQQRKALIQAGGFRLESSPPLVYSAHPRDLTFAGGLQPDCILHSVPLPTEQNDCISYQPPSLCSLLPSSSPVGPQYQTTYADSDELHSSSPQGPGMPQLVMEFLLCDPDELQLQNKISARIQQEQTGWRRHGNPGTFSLMCVMADQTLLSIVEWARTSIFFKQLKVSDQMKLLHSCWSELLILDIISRQVLYGRVGSLLLVTGQEVR
uniref:Nuclear receptor subfamily 5 group A member 2-like n=1 Tax=Seriola dumerili TaxID=41447 RepID=A0A3B4U5V6_SERDU